MELIGKSALEIFVSVEKDAHIHKLKTVFGGKPLDFLEVRILTKEGEERVGEMGMRPIWEDANVSGIQCIVRDITERRRIEDALRDSESKLREQKIDLEQKNIALREILEQIELEKKRIKDDIYANIDKLLLPTLKKLKGRTPSGSAKYITLLERNLEAVASSFGRKISEKGLMLTPREVEICNMIKHGFSSKEISGLLSLSLQTIERHRNNIRAKLGIVNKDINLTTRLQTF